MFREFLRQMFRPKYVRLLVHRDVLPELGEIGRVVAEQAEHHRSLLPMRAVINPRRYLCGHAIFDDLLVPNQAGIPGSFEPYRLRGVLPHDKPRDLMGMSFDRIADGETIRIALCREHAEALSGLIKDYLRRSQSPRSSETPSSLKTTPGPGEGV